MKGFAPVAPRARSLYQGIFRGPVRVSAAVVAPPKEEEMVAAAPQVGIPCHPVWNSVWRNINVQRRMQQPLRKKGGVPRSVRILQMAWPVNAIQISDSMPPAT